MTRFHCYETQAQTDTHDAYEGAFDFDSSEVMDSYVLSLACNRGWKEESRETKGNTTTVVYRHTDGTSRVLGYFPLPA
jgi:hypothetical protein